MYRFQGQQGYVDFRRPINQVHPLAFQRWGWWLALRNNSHGPKVFDLMGGSAGTLTGATTVWTPSTRPGALGPDISVSGVITSYVLVTPADPASGDQAWSFGAWVKFTNTASAIEVILFNGTDSAGLKKAFFLYRSATGKAVIETGSGVGAATGTTTLAGSTWYRVVGTYDKSNIRIYVNGLKEATTAMTSMNLVAGKTIMGAYFDSGGNFALPMNGLINDSFISHRALSDSEVALDYTMSQQSWEKLLQRKSPEIAFTEMVATVFLLRA
jgi:hypothetical protein